MSTKLAAEIKNYDDAVAAIDGSLATMGLDHIDLMLIHSPAAVERLPRRRLRRGQPRGVARPRGRPQGREDPLHRRLQLPAAGPGEHPRLLHRRPARRTSCSSTRATPRPSSSPTARASSILVEAYSPIAHGAILTNPDVRGDRREVRRDRSAAVHPLHAAAGHRLAAQDGEPRAHAVQRRGGLRHLRRGHGRPARTSRPGTTANTARSRSTAASDGIASHAHAP